MSETLGDRSGRVLRGRDWLMLPVFAGGCLLLGSLAALTMGGSVDGWYQTLNRPALTPPERVFGVVWTILYLAMGTAAWLIWHSRDRPGAKAALGLFAAQLVLNLSWTPVFFGLQNVLLGFVVIVPILLAVAATTVAFWRVSRVAGWIFVPYLAWVAFATVIACRIWQMNG